MLSINNVFTEEELYTVKNYIVESAYFPWYHFQYSSSENYPFYGHILVKRDDVQANSDWYPFFKNILNRFLRKANLYSNGYTILRASLNDSLSYKDKACDAHIDHEEEHDIVIMYLTDSSGNTNIYNRKWDGKEPSTYRNTENKPDMEIEYTIKPEAGKVALFNGLNFHSVDFKKESDRRIICIFAIKEKK